MSIIRTEVVVMSKIEGFRVKNFRALKDVTLGRLWNQQQVQPLSPLTVVIGKNGVGKSTLFDAFGFLADCLKSGVEEACDIELVVDLTKFELKDKPVPLNLKYITGKMEMHDQ